MGGDEEEKEEEKEEELEELSVMPAVGSCTAVCYGCGASGKRQRNCPNK